MVFALGLRVYQASHHVFTSDELMNIRIADTIRLSLSDPHIVLAGPDHPLLNVYTSHIGALVFGKTVIGYRVANVLFGALTCWAVYLLAREIGKRNAGLWAAALLAIDQFHTTLSGAVNSNDVGVIFFGTLALVSCARLTPQAGLRPFLGLGLWMGLAYLSKETAVLLFPVPWIFLLLSRERRAVLMDSRWYLAHLVFLIVVAPDLWNLATTGGWLQASSNKAIQGNGFPIQGKVVSLFFGELVMMAEPDILGGTDRYWCWPLRTVHWAAGVLYLFATVWALRFWRQPAVLLLQLCFWVTVFAVSLMPGQDYWDPFWWASMAISPAVAFSGVYLSEWTRGRIQRVSVAALLLAWLLVRTVSQQMTTYCYPGTNVEPPDDDVASISLVTRP